MLLLVFIMVFVLYLLAIVVINFMADQDLEFYDNIHGYPGDNVVHNTWIEFIWTVIPTIILAFIALPSFILLYSMD